MAGWIPSWPLAVVFSASELALGAIFFSAKPFCAFVCINKFAGVAKVAVALELSVCWVTEPGVDSVEVDADRRPIVAVFAFQ